jgi:hypothetical protein
MATPEMRGVELDPLAPSFDRELKAVQSEEQPVAEADPRELPAYSFDSDDKTLVGIGTSGSADSSQVRGFDSSDRTLVGIGPAERAKRAKLAELASHSQQAESAPEGVAMPHSEPPGPFVASDDQVDAPPRQPMQKRQPWLLALSAVLLAAVAVALLRGVVPHTTAPRLHSAATVAPLPTANETRADDEQFETLAATSAETAAVEIPVTQASQAVPLPTTQRERQAEFAPGRVTTKAAVREPLGALDVTSNPPAGLVLDGRPLGKAPRVIQLPPGPHTVLFVHPERGRMSVTVNVRAGRTTSASADF